MVHVLQRGCSSSFHHELYLGYVLSVHPQISLTTPRDYYVECHFIFSKSPVSH